MSDDVWRRRGLEGDDDFGPPLFDDDRDDRSTLSFGATHHEPLPHWTEPPTGEVPDVLATGQHDLHADVDVWSSFSDQGPVWGDEPTNPDGEPGHAPGRLPRRKPSFDDLDDLDDLSPRFEEAPPARFQEPSRGLFDDDAPAYEAPTTYEVPTTYDEPVTGLFDEVAEYDAPPPPRREQGRIQIGTDPTDGAMARPPMPRGRPRPGEPVRGPRPPRPGAPGRGPAPRPVGGTKGRDMPTAIAVGLMIAAVFILAVKTKPVVVGIFVVLVLGMAGIEYFDRVREKGYEPAFLPGIAACVTAPLAVYHYGVGALPLVMVLAFGACGLTFIGARGLESNPMPNMAISMLGICWIAMMGSFGAAIVGVSNFGGGNHIGTDTLTLLAIAVVANDVGALFVGSAVGKSPLRAWISPNKSIEGFIGGTIASLGAMVLVGVWGKSTTWNNTGELLMLGLVVAVVGPIGDLTESMFKRNLDVKDFGSIIKGHGGVLDRFDAFLFAMPAAYYLLEYLQPWTSK
jgi:phosphatidate cytidylyltransferase